MAQSGHLWSEQDTSHWNRDGLRAKDIGGDGVLTQVRLRTRIGGTANATQLYQDSPMTGVRPCRRSQAISHGGVA